MGIIPTEHICLETTLSAANLRHRLASFVEPDSTTPEFCGTLGDETFRLKYLLKPSFVEGTITPKEYGCELEATVMLPSYYNLLVVFAYASFTVAVFLVALYFMGVAAGRHPFALSGLSGSVMLFIPSLVSYLIFTSSLRTAHRWQELLFESLVKYPEMEWPHDPQEEGE